MPSNDTITWDDILKAEEELEREGTRMDAEDGQWEWGAWDVICKNGYITFFPKGLLKKAGWDGE